MKIKIFENLLCLFVFLLFKQTLNASILEPIKGQITYSVSLMDSKGLPISGSINFLFQLGYFSNRLGKSEEIIFEKKYNQFLVPLKKAGQINLTVDFEKENTSIEEISAHSGLEARLVIVGDEQKLTKFPALAISPVFYAHRASVADSANKVDASAISSGTIDPARLPAMANAVVDSTNIKVNAVGTNQIANGSVTSEKLGLGSCENGQVIKKVGAVFACANDENSIPLDYTKNPLSMGNSDTISAQNNPIVRLKDPSNQQDAATKNYVDSQLADQLSTNASATRSSLGLGSMATQNANLVNITGGSISGLANPTLASEASNKAYVDTTAAALQTNISAAQSAAANAQTAAANAQTAANAAVTLSGNQTISGDKIFSGAVSLGSSSGPLKATAGVLGTAAINLGSNEVTGLLPSAHGGTGANLAAANGVLKATTGVIAATTILNADIDNAAAITDGKLATISSAGKVANSATTGASANTANALVLRDASGNFSAHSITLSGPLTLGNSDSDSAQNNAIVRLKDPSNQQDAATKKYVDTTAAALQTNISAAQTAANAAVTLSGNQTISGDKIFSGAVSLGSAASGTFTTLSSTGNVTFGGSLNSASINASNQIVAGSGVKVGADSSTCNSANEGLTRYNPTSKTMEFCNASAWTLIGASAVPSGAISPFNLAECPSGWTELTGARGRTIIGVGTGAGLTERLLNTTGGEENHTLTVAEMPSHAHTDSGHGHGVSGGTTAFNGAGVYAAASMFWQGWVGNWGHMGITINNGSANIQSNGGGGAHNNMQPWIAYLFCQKN